MYKTLILDEKLKNDIKYKIKFLFIYNNLLAECKILKNFSKIQSFYFLTVPNISK